MGGGDKVVDEWSEWVSDLRPAWIVKLRLTIHRCKAFGGMRGHECVPAIVGQYVM